MTGWVPNVGDVVEVYLPTKPGWFSGRVFKYDGGYDHWGVQPEVLPYPVFKNIADLRPVSSSRPGTPEEQR